MRLSQLRFPRRAHSCPLILLLLACGGGAADPSTRSYQAKLQTIDRFARAERPEAGRLVVTLHDNGRASFDRATVAPMARRIAERAYADGDARSGDTLIVEYHRGRQLGPLTFGAAVRRFTFFGPPPAPRDIRSPIPP
ncbi:MAG: hypothetical protein LC797_06475 [Chloroflexi bacterium]|nr:hypothetical protein [Chloroflexota bacterium]